eukprot:TRINITY_DN29626_c0_g1_i1.p1 TRINITY_DN29626_c0_g1~~TRINITY_DN29626_c0_g1_i1.p1  ORF type:complete len:342 (+),score=57.17 TRINITY_DN29626_c0_g1_i1:153-1178(+)
MCIRDSNPTLIPPVNWSAHSGRLPNSGPGVHGGFATRAIDCLMWPPDGRTYCYTDVSLHSNPVCPGAYMTEIGCFSSPDGVADWRFHGIAIHRNQSGSEDSGGVATPAAIVTNGMVYVFFSQEGGPPAYNPVTSLPNGPRGIGIGRAFHPLGPFKRLPPAVPAPPWPLDHSWNHGSHPGGILDDSQLLEYDGEYHLFHSRKLSTDTPGCPPSVNGSNPCCVEWRVSQDAENWVRRGVVLTRAAPCEQQACEPMSARVLGDMLLLVTDGGACGQDTPLGLASFTASTRVLKGLEPFDFAPTIPPLLSEYMRFPAVSYTHLRAHETPEHLVCRLLLEKKKQHN